MFPVLLAEEDCSRMVQFAACWYSLSNLVQFGEAWCRLVQCGASWCSLV